MLYPLGRVWEEVYLVGERQRTDSRTQTTLMHQAVSSAIGVALGDKKALGQFKKLMKELDE